MHGRDSGAAVGKNLLSTPNWSCDNANTKSRKLHIADIAYTYNHSDNIWD